MICTSFEYKFEGVEVSEPLIVKSLSDLGGVPAETVNLIQARGSWQFLPDDYFTTGLVIQSGQ